MSAAATAGHAKGALAVANQDGPGVFAVTGVTGQVGGVVARTLLAEGEPVRAVVRSRAKVRPWEGCEVAVADMADAAALTAAFEGAAGVFVLPPPNFAPSVGFPEAKAVAAAVTTALAAARPRRVVCISTIGAQASEENLLTQLTIMEDALGELPIPVTFLRPAWYMENAAWDVGPAAQSGVFDSYLQPLDRAIPMVATADVGRVAAELLRQDWTGRRIVELEGPRRVSPNDVAATLSKLLGRPVRARAVPRHTWASLFAFQGTAFPEPRVRMLDGFNEGWIRFEADEAHTLKGTVTLEAVLAELLARSDRHVPA
jgi:uncharacterized protein YbjT (DUF2867 family)